MVNNRLWLLNNTYFFIKYSMRFLKKLKALDKKKALRGTRL